jgi:Protein of unknown function (DUF1236)
MNTCLRRGIVAVAIAMGLGPASAQLSTPGGSSASPGATQSSELQLSAAQRTAILNAIRQDNRKISPGNFPAAVGGQVPPSIDLYPLPNGALSQAPELNTLKYTMTQNNIVLVDPTRMRVVEVIRP